MRFLSALFVGVMITGLSSMSLDGHGPRANQAEATPKAKSKISRCVRYTQVMGEDKQSVDISLRNRCKAPVACVVEWKVSCDGEDTETREFSDAMKLAGKARETVTASAAVCGDEGWAVDDIEWECEPL